MLALAKCAHVPPFEPIAARGLDSDEVRNRWPRNEPGERCRVCGAPLFSFASEQHMIAGDWSH